MTVPSESLTLADRMKSYELVTRATVPPRSWTVIRLDGRAFHTWTKGLHRPFDYDLIANMGGAMQSLAENISGTVVGYHQSDEISLVLTDFARPDTEAFYGGQVQKLVSVSASMLTAFMARRYPHRPKLPTFDARVFTVPNRTEVGNYLLWRQRDAQVNSVSMIASHHFSHKQLLGKGMRDRIDMLEEAGIDWDAAPDSFLHGQTVHKEKVVDNVSWTDRDGNVHLQSNVERWRWFLRPADQLYPGGWLDRVLPPDPQGDVPSE